MQQPALKQVPHHPSAFVAHPPSANSTLISPYHSNASLLQTSNGAPAALHHPPHHITLQSPNVAAAAAAAGVQLHSPGRRRESVASLSSHDSNMKEIEESNAAIAMLRLKKNIEQKEEFMRRPNQQQQPQQQQQQMVSYPPTQPLRRPVVVSPTPQQQQILQENVDAANGGMPREFYSRPKKLQRPIWPPTLDEQHQQALRKMENQFQPINSPTAQQMQQSKLLKSKCREQFFNMLQQNEGGSASGDDSVKDKSEDCPIPANGLHIVSEKTKLFESGRPLSPDGSNVDRTLLYKSELSRLNQKVPTPNVALRKKEYEQIHDHSDYSRLSTDTETIVSDAPSVSTSATAAAPPQQQHQQPVYNRGVVGGGGEETHLSPVVVVRREPKQPVNGGGADAGGVGEDDRRMRRISYLRATANDTHLEINNNNTSNNSGETKKSSGSSEYAENDRAMAMNVISDNRDKRRHGRQMEQDEPEDEGVGDVVVRREEAINDKEAVVGEYNEEEMALLLRGSTDKRRVSSASILALHEGPMQIKITLIDGKRSHDRSWKNVWAELKGNKLNLTVQREGKPNQVRRNRVECKYKK